MLIVVISSNLLMGVGFFLLQAWVGLGMCAVAICRDVVSFITDGKRKSENKNKTTKFDWMMLALWTTALVLITAFTQEGFWTWFAFFATYTFTISIWQKNILAYKIMGILVGAFWIIYNINVKNLFGIILESLLAVVVITGLIVYILKLKKDKQKNLPKESTPKDI